MGNKNFLLILGFVFSTILGGKVYAGEIEKSCAQQFGWHPMANSAVTMQYNNCVSEAYRVQQEQANVPEHPGNPPAYTCAQYQQPLIPEHKFEQCKAEYDAAKATYDGKMAAYQNYIAAHPNMNTTRELSAAQVLEDIAAKQQKSADRLKRIANTLRNIGIALGLAGAALMLWPVTAAAGKVLIVIGIGFTLMSMIVQGKANKIAREKIQSCEDLNKILTKPMSCDAVQEQTPVDGTFMSTNYDFNGTSGTSDIPEFIDPKTGKCKAPATAECATLVKSAPKDCFKANAKGVSCMAGSKAKSPISVLSNGKVSANVNGKQRTFGSEDFADEASMIKAGFTKDQAKQFLALTNDPNSILAKNGLNAKGELIKSSSVPSVSLTKPSSSEASGTGGAASMNTKKDEYGPAQAVEVARVPASAEGLTKDYHGDKIGAEGDDVFKMINRRYILKQKQNIFIDQ